MQCERLVFSRHAIQRMFERAISTAEVRQAVVSGETIEEYPEADPYPGVLILGFPRAGRPLHIVVGRNPEGTCFVVTVYEPDNNLWIDGFKRRKRR